MAGLQSATHCQEGQVRQRRSSVSEKIKKVERKAERSLLLLWDDLPSWRRDNEYIHSGYRSIEPSYLHSFLGLFHLHNESVNIWSHLLGSLSALFLGAYLYYVIRPRYEAASSSDVLVFACFFAGAVLCMGMSATFHSLLSHSHEVASFGNKLDYSGIIVLIVGSFVPTLYYGFFCKPKLLTSYLYLICVLATGCAIASWLDKFRTAKYRPYRAAMFVGLGLSSVIPIIHALKIYGYQGLEDRISVSWVAAQGGFYIFGAALYACRFPERYWPGIFDIWGSSHQLFHGFVVLAAATHLYGLAKAYDYHHSNMESLCLIE